MNSNLVRIALVTLVFLVGMQVGEWRRPPSGSALGALDSTAIDRMATPSARLTAPWYEPTGFRALAGPLVLLERDLAARVDELRAADPTLRVGIYLRDLEGGVWIGVGEDEGFVPASLMKVAVLFHALSRVEKDPALLDREVVYPGPGSMPSASNTDGLPAAERMVAGRAYPFRELLRRMIAYSDNHAKDLVLDGVAPAEVDAWMTEIGFPTLVEESRAVTTAKAYGGLFRILYNSSLFSRANSEFALELLLAATFEGGMRAALPPEVPLASKFGSHFDARDLSSGVQLHECGIVYGGDPWVVCVMTRSSLKSLQQLGGVVQEVTRAALEARGSITPGSRGSRPRRGP